MARPKGSKNKKAVKKESSEVKPAYSIVITLGDKILRGEGATLGEALANIPRPLKVVSRGTVVVSTENDSKVLAYKPHQIKRLFFPIARHVVIKQLQFGLQ